MYGVVNTVTMADNNGETPVKPNRKRGSGVASGSEGQSSRQRNPNETTDSAAAGGFTPQWREDMETRAARRVQQVAAVDAQNPPTGRRVEAHPSAHPEEIDEEARPPEESDRPPVG